MSRLLTNQNTVLPDPLDHVMKMSNSEEKRTDDDGPKVGIVAKQDWNPTIGQLD